MSKNILGPHIGYVDLMYEGMRKSAEEYRATNTLEKRCPLRPSSSGDCTRALAYKTMEWLGRAEYATEENPQRVRMLLDLGHGVEWHLIKWFKEAKPWFQGTKYKDQVVELFYLDTSNVPEKDVVLIEGEIDTCFWSEKHKAAIDFKSKGDKFDRAYKSNWAATDAKLEKIATKLPSPSYEYWEDYERKNNAPTSYWVDDLPTFLAALDDPMFEANFLQLNLYAHSKFLQDRGVDHGAIIQYNKNDSRIREVRFRLSEELFLRVKNKFQAALSAAGKGNPEEAPRDFALGSSKCAFCPFKKQCYPELRDDAVRKAFFRTMSKKWPTDTGKLVCHAEIEKLFGDLAETEKPLANRGKIEESIIKIMRKEEISKIRLDNGDIYVLKYLKTPKEHYELRRGKL